MNWEEFLADGGQAEFDKKVEEAVAAATQNLNFDDYLKKGGQSEFDKRITKALSTAKQKWEEEKNAEIEKCILVVGHKQEQVRETMGDSVLYAVQSEQLGTGHAVMQAIPQLENADKVVVLCGDAPLLSSDTLKEALRMNEEKQEFV